VDSEPEFYVPDVWRGRSANKKQGSEGNITISDDIVEEVYDDTIARYRLLLDIGVCPEQARMVLPQSMMTEWYWSGSLDAFADMCALRCSYDTQVETQQVALEIDRMMSDLFPVSWKALRENER
jgi:thymidylate synthase (FAD)